MHQWWCRWIITPLLATHLFKCKLCGIHVQWPVMQGREDFRLQISYTAYMTQQKKKKKKSQVRFEIITRREANNLICDWCLCEECSLRRCVAVKAHSVLWPCSCAERWPSLLWTPRVLLCNMIFCNSPLWSPAEGNKVIRVCACSWTQYRLKVTKYQWQEKKQKPRHRAEEKEPVKAVVPERSPLFSVQKACAWLWVSVCSCVYYLLFAKISVNPPLLTGT